MAVMAPRPADKKAALGVPDGSTHDEEVKSETVKAASGKAKGRAEEEGGGGTGQVLPLHQILAFCLVEFSSTLMLGAAIVVEQEYTQVYGVGLFYQALTALLIMPAGAYSGLIMSYISDNLHSPRFGRYLSRLRFVACELNRGSQAVYRPSLSSMTDSSAPMLSASIIFKLP